MVSEFKDPVTRCHTNGVERAWKPLKEHWRQKKKVPLHRFDATLQAWLYQYNMRRSGMRYDRIIDAIIHCFH